MKNQKMNIYGKGITILVGDKEEYISLTDIARYKDDTHTDDIAKNWMRNRNTIELLGLWELLHNSDFKPVEFDGFKKQAGLHGVLCSNKIKCYLPLEGVPEGRGRIELSIFSINTDLSVKILRVTDFADRQDNFLITLFEIKNKKIVRTRINNTIKIFKH
jgi:hypothetical protein